MMHCQCSSFALLYPETVQFLGCAVEYIDVYLLSDAGKTASVGTLPDGPFLAYSGFGDIVPCNPKRIIGKMDVVDVACVEFLVGVDYGLYLVVLFNY